MSSIQLNCKKEYHYYQPILGVCIDQKCQEKKPFCQVCIEKSHSHLQANLLNFKKLQDWVSEFFIKFEKALKYMTDCSTLIEILYNKLDQLGITQLDQFIKEMINTETILDMVQPSLKQSIELLDKVNQQYNNRQSNDIIIQLENHILQDKKYKSSEYTTPKHETIHVSKPIHQQIIPKFLDINFSNQQRISDVEITTNGKKVSCLKSPNFVLGQPMIPKTGITKFAIKLIDPVSYVALGVGNKDILNQNKYNVDLYNQSAHGTYLINSYGVVFSHSSQKNLKSNISCFSFKVNDTIIIELNMKESKITWIKLADNSNYSIGFDKTLDLYPLLNLNQTAVQVVDQI